MAKSIVIVGGNDCMVRRYKDLCEGYCDSCKVFTQMKAGLKNKVGNPDLMIIFTGTMCHKMLQLALSEVKGTNVKIVRSHSSSVSALKGILEEHAAS